MGPPGGQSTVLQQCLDRLRAGDPSAREELIRRACDRLDRLARKMLQANPRVRRWEETGDLRQTAMVKLYRALESVHPPTVVDFFRLAASHLRQTLIDLARRHYGPEGAAAHHASVAGPSGQLPEPAAAPSTDPAADAAWGEFHEAAGRLGEQERAVFDLLWYHGLSQPEAADVLGIPLRTLQRLWRTARLTLGPLLPCDADDAG
jgi:RNA polymerase sigma-70 factor (ECF subfamily)